MKYFPIILYPQKIKEIVEHRAALLSQLQPTSLEVSQLPKPPASLGASPKLKIGSVLQPVNLMSVLVVYLLSQFAGLGITVFAAIVATVLLSISTRKAVKVLLQQRRSYILRCSSYEAEFTNYKLKLEDYEVTKKFSKVIYEDNLKKVKEIETTVAFCNKLLHQALKEAAEPFDEKNEHEGQSEKILREALQRYFPGKIYTDLALQHPEHSESYPYNPDFMYFDSRWSLRIDIEVDEPYSHSSKDPIHFIGKDDKRNEFFCESGWIVIRFSEEQVKSASDGCCKEVAKIVAEVLEDLHILTEFGMVKDLEKQPQWTEEDARKMAEEGFRGSKKPHSRRNPGKSYNKGKPILKNKNKSGT